MKHEAEHERVEKTLGTNLFWECPGCGFGHSICVSGDPRVNPVWSWNGSTTEPTFQPSVLVRWTHGEERTEKVCHFFVEDGFIQFLGDCTHDMASSIVPMNAIEVDSE